jgi:hypothetical protein
MLFTGALANDYDDYVPLSADNMDPSDSFDSTI